MGERAISFDSVAEDYLRARSEYPPEMFNRIFRTASLTNNSRVFDVGCGSGQATLEFVRRGASVIALDPAKSALDLLTQRCDDLGKVDLVHAKFEDFDDALRPDLITCGQAFHWLNPTTAPNRFADLLGPGGYIALFWHLQDIAPETPQANLYTMSSKFFNSFPIMNPPEYGREFIDAMAEVLEKSGRFEDLNVLEFPWQQSYQPEMFGALLRSSSNYAQLDDESKIRISSESDEHVRGLDSDPEISYRTCLIEARVRGI